MPKSQIGWPGAQGTRPITPSKPAPNDATKTVAASAQVAKNYHFTESFPQGRGHADASPPALKGKD